MTDLANIQAMKMLMVSAHSDALRPLTWTARKKPALFRAEGATTRVRQPFSRGRLSDQSWANRYRYRGVALVIGISGGLLYALQGAWTYTNFLRAASISVLGQGNPRCSSPARCCSHC